MKIKLNTISNEEKEKYQDDLNSEDYNFILETVDMNNKIHEAVMLKLASQPGFNYIGSSVDNMLDIVEAHHNMGIEDNAYIIWYNDFPIGYFADKVIDDNHELTCAILNEYRGQGLASLLTSDYTDYLINNYGKANIRLKIDKNNISSIKTVSKIGYTLDNDGYYKLK